MTRRLRPAVLIDKDGTLVDDVPYSVDPTHLTFRAGALSALARLASEGFALLIVTNQSGLALGYFGYAQWSALCHALTERIARETGVRLVDIAYCPHAPDAEGHPVCPCRKPAPGLLREAAASYGLDLQRSWMVGDTLDDVEAGRRAGCRTILYDSGGETLWRRALLRYPDAHVYHWSDVTRTILERRPEAPSWAHSPVLRTGAG